MKPNRVEQWTIKNVALEGSIGVWIESFLIDRKAQNMARGTLYFYRAKLKLFAAYCEAQAATAIEHITPDLLRLWLLHLQDTGHNPGGIHAAYRAARAFLLWYEAETEPAGWSNPIRKVKAPKVPAEIIEPVDLDTVKEIYSACSGSLATRDRALILFLLDTGARAAEVCAVNLADVDIMTGSVTIRQGKGRKPRTVFVGQKARRQLRAYIKTRTDSSPALWVTADSSRLTYWGLNQILARRAKAAGVKKPGLHDFRRAFALNFLRNNPGDIASLQRIMGHAPGDIKVLRRYLAQTDTDLLTAHRRGSPVDNSL